MKEYVKTLPNIINLGCPGGCESQLVEMEFLEVPQEGVAPISSVRFCQWCFSFSADGNYEVTLMTKATVYYNGLVVWQPPAVYKSSCAIDVEFFPYDVQTCVLKLGSWTYDGFKVRGW